jgi:aspartate/glutamate racemase
MRRIGMLGRMSWESSVHRTIHDELCLGVVRPESLRAYQQVVGRLVERSGTVEGPDTPGGWGWPPVFTGQRPAGHGLRFLASNS